LYLQSAGKRSQPLSHSSKSDTPSARFDQFVLSFQGYTLPAILNLNSQTIPFLMDTDCSRGTPGMTVDVRQTFLHDPEDGNLQFVR
jgi:hypothetical protein